MKPVILYGCKSVAKMLFIESKKMDSDFHIVAFCVGDNYLNGETSYCGLPLVVESEVAQKYPPDKYDMLTCVVSSSRVRNRLLIYERLKSMGYFLRNFISPLAKISENVQIGENNIILDYVRIEHNTCIGHSNIIFSGTYISNDSVIGNSSTFTDRVTIGSDVEIGNSCWFGYGSIVNNLLKIADDTLVSTGAVILKNTKQGFTYVGNPAKAYRTHQETGIMMHYPQKERKLGL